MLLMHQGLANPQKFQVTSKCSLCAVFESRLTSWFSAVAHGIYCLSERFISFEHCDGCLHSILSSILFI